MLHYLIKITDNTLPTVIAFSLLLFLASTLSRDKRFSFRLYGIAAGVAAALAYALLKRNTGIAIREYYDLGVLVPSLLLSLVMLAVLWRRFRAAGEAGRCERLLAALLLAVWTAYVLPNNLLYPFEFAVGMESIFNTDFCWRVIGYCLGLLLMFLLGLGLHAIAGKLPRAFLLAVFAAVLLLFFAKQSLEVAQILVARNMIPRYGWLMAAVIFILTHVNWFAFALMGFAAFLVGSLMLRVRREPERAGNPALKRKQKAEGRTAFRYSACVLVCLLASSLTITVFREHDNQDVEISPPIELPATDGNIVIPLATINDGNLHRFVHTTPEGTAVRYIVIKKSETAYGVGLDACDICGPSGYYQRKTQVICKLCDVVMNISTIGFPGGCNPVPLRFSVSQGNMLIPLAALNAEQQRFQ